jgi:hypothetical protein
MGRWGTGRWSDDLFGRLIGFAYTLSTTSTKKENAAQIKYRTWAANVFGPVSDDEPREPERFGITVISHGILAIHIWSQV